MELFILDLYLEANMSYCVGVSQSMRSKKGRSCFLKELFHMPGLVNHVTSPLFGSKNCICIICDYLRMVSNTSILTR